MKTTKIEKWSEKLQDGTEVEQTLLKVINTLLSSKDPKTLPRGIEQFRIFGRISKAFEEAEKTGILKLEDSDYNFLKNIVEEDIPANWGAIPNVNKAITAFLEAKDGNN